MTKYLLAIACAITLVLGPACDDADDPTPPDQTRYRILGTVTDPGGLPITRAFVNIDYLLLVDGGLRPRTTVHYEVADEADVRVEILDTAGRLVRLLVDGPQSGGTYSTQWDGLDDDGNRVPEGLYRAEISVDGELASSTELFVETPILSQRATTHITLTDEFGEFSLDVDDLSAGVVLGQAPGEEGVLSVGSVIDVYAFRGGSTAHDIAEVDLSDVTSDIEVELVIPYGRATPRIAP